MPRAIRRAPDGSVFVAEAGAGRLLRFTAAGERTTFAEGLDLPYGIAFWPPAAPRFVYVAETGRVLRYPWHPGAPAASGPAEIVVPVLPTGGHWTRDLAAAPDGSRIFLAVGSGSNVGDDMGPQPQGGVVAWQAAHGVGAAWGAEAGRAGVFWLRPEGGALHPYAQGLRNCAGLGCNRRAARCGAWSTSATGWATICRPTTRRGFTTARSTAGPGSISAATPTRGAPASAPTSPAT